MPHIWLDCQCFSSRSVQVPVKIASEAQERHPASDTDTLMGIKLVLLRHIRFWASLSFSFSNNFFPHCFLSQGIKQEGEESAYDRIGDVYKDLVSLLKSHSAYFANQINTQVSGRWWGCTGVHEGRVCECGGACTWPASVFSLPPSPTCFMEPIGCWELSSISYLAVDAL